MSCAQIQLIVREISGTLPAEVEQHLQRCEACSTVRQNYATLGELLPEVPAPPLPDGFELDLRRQLKDLLAEAQPAAEATRDEPRAPNDPLQIPRHRSLPLALAAAAALLMLLGAWLVLRNHGPAGDPAPAALKVSYHKLRIEVETALGADAARFEVHFPEGVALAPQAGDALQRSGRAMRWQSRLRPGRSSVELPLVARVHHSTAVHVHLAMGHSTYRARAFLRPKSTISFLWLQPVRTLTRQLTALPLLLATATTHAAKAEAQGLKLTATTERISASTLAQVAWRLLAAMTTRSGRPSQVTLHHLAAHAAPPPSAFMPSATSSPGKAKPEHSTSKQGTAPRPPQGEQPAGAPAAASPDVKGTTTSKGTPAAKGSSITNQLLQDADKLARPRTASPAAGATRGASVRSSTPTASGTERLHAPPQGASTSERRASSIPPGTAQGGAPGSGVGAPGTHSSGTKRTSSGARK